MNYIKLEELEFQYQGESMPLHKEMYWALFKNNPRL